METKINRILICSGPLMVLMFLTGLLVFAGWIPPSDPADQASDVVGRYAANPNGIMFGMILAMIGSALLTPWGVAISGSLNRIEGVRPLAEVQKLSSTIGALTFIIPLTLWIGAGYRYNGRSADVTQVLQDIGWLQFVCVVWVVFFQMIAIGWAILADRGGDPVLPQWVGYLNLWAAAGVFPAGVVPFFHGGPFAWNGAVGFFVPLVSFCVWMLTTSWAVFMENSRRIANEERNALTLNQP